MTPDVKVFQDDKIGAVRYVDIDGKPWLFMEDACKTLGLNDPTMLLDRLDEDERTKIDFGRQGETDVVSEPGMYSLAFFSLAATGLKRWITHEVIPSIRKNGLYAKDEIIDKMLSDPDWAIMALTKFKEERATRNEAEIQK